MRPALVILCLGIALPAFCQNPGILRVRNWRQQQEQPIIREFVSFLSIPNIAADSVNIQKNAAFIVQMMRDRNIGNIQLLKGKNGYPPAVYGEIIVPGATRTIGFYAHYDGQPVNPAQWAAGLSPFVPVLYDRSLLDHGKPIPFPASGPYDPEWRIYGRAASDDKAGVISILNAYQALMVNGIKPGSNIKFLFEGEEEAGSVHLGDIFEANASLLHTDCWIICDGPVHQSGRKQIVLGVRGDTHIDLTVYGPKRPLHSGHYGNWANNPAMMLVKLLASMKDDSGRVTIKGFYDDVQPLSAMESKALHEVPDVDEQMKKELGFVETEIKGLSLSEAINLPSLNINGMYSGNVGSQASNQIPTFAEAVLDLRLVLGNDWQRQQQKVIDHIRAKGYTVLDHDPTDAERLQYSRIAKVTIPGGSYNAQRTPMDLPVIQKIRKAVQGTISEPLVLQPTLGGSLPLYLFEKYLQAPTVTVPVANHDNNQHAENENIRLFNLWAGIESMASIMIME
ncbi:MAG: peptidase M20 [Sphingobacteriales bacterium 50-39]|nr:M20/M25/M40 family metallo-hydrolase [Sphingobacteriales bacterium]OJW55652.1 MAG: peptidase M20 [Sphingobacteriales bacterium 50-39]